METILFSLPTLSVSGLYCLWHTYQLARQQRQRQLCERVAHLLWITAQLPEAGSPEAGSQVSCGPGQPTPLYPHRPLILSEPPAKTSAAG